MCLKPEGILILCFPLLRRDFDSDMGLVGKRCKVETQLWYELMIWAMHNPLEESRKQQRSFIHFSSSTSIEARRFCYSIF